MNFLRTNLFTLNYNDSYLCLASSPYQAQNLLYEAKRKGAKYLFSYFDFNYWPNHKKIDRSAKSRTTLVDNFYNKEFVYPSIIAVTGTNGKTSTCCLLQKGLEYHNVKSFLSSTIGQRSQSSHPFKSSGLTTLEYADLKAALINTSLANFEFFIIEASSQALAQDRLGSLSFKAVASTEVQYSDHRDYHPTFEHYAVSKAKLFNNYESELKIIDFRNKLCPFIKRLYTQINLDYYPKCNRSLKAALSYPNLSLASSILKYLRLPMKYLDEVWIEQSRIEGRFEEIGWNKNRSAIVDYAHCPFGLEYLCKALKSFQDRPIWLLLSCAGGRDRKKRSQMLDIALKYAEHIVITEDNSRDESFNNILSDMLQWKNFINVKVIEDRKKAISYAYENAPQGSYIVISGKGHEKFITRSRSKIEHQDLIEAKKFLLNH